MKKYFLGLFIFLLTINLVACSNDGNGQKSENETVEISEEEMLPEDEVVAIVNGEEVTGKTYNLVYTQEKMYQSQFEEDIDLDEMKESAVELVIERQILFQEARK